MLGTTLKHGSALAARGDTNSWPCGPKFLSTVFVHFCSREQKEAQIHKIHRHLCNWETPVRNYLLSSRPVLLHAKLWKMTPQYIIGLLWGHLEYIWENPQKSYTVSQSDTLLFFWLVCGKAFLSFSRNIDFLLFLTRQEHTYHKIL